MNESLGWARQQGATHFALLPGSMALLRPLPLSSLRCPLAPFQSFTADNWDRCVTVVTRNLPADHDCRTRNCCARFSQRGGIGGGGNTTHGRNGSISSGARFAWLTSTARENYEWTVRQARRFGAAEAVGVAGHVVALGFVCDRWALLRLHELGLFREVSITSKGQAQAAERLMGVVAETAVRSPPERCALDGDYRQPPRYVKKASHSAHAGRPWIHTIKSHEPKADGAAAHESAPGVLRTGAVCSG